MIHIQQHRVRALKQNPLVLPHRAQQRLRRVIDERCNPPAKIPILLKDRPPIHRRHIVKTLQHLIPLGHDPPDALFEFLFVLQIRHPNRRVPLHLVGISRPDSAPGSADFIVPARFFTSDVDAFMERKNHMSCR